MTAASAPPVGAIPLETARQLLAARMTPVTAAMTQPAEASLGRVAAEDIVSTIDLPRTHNAAVDGYGVLAKTLADAPTTAFTIVGVARAGQEFIEEFDAVELNKVKKIK